MLKGVEIHRALAHRRNPGLRLRAEAKIRNLLPILLRICCLTFQVFLVFLYPVFLY